MNQEILLQVWSQSGIPKPIAEHKFSDQGNWRFDYAFLEQRVAVEIQGGLFVVKGARRCPVCKQTPAGRHTRGPALRDEYEKLREAAADGWLVLPVPPDEAMSKKFLTQLKRALAG